MEYRKICNVCHNIWCYTDNDVKENAKNLFFPLSHALMEQYIDDDNRAGIIIKNRLPHLSSENKKFK